MLCVYVCVQMCVGKSGTNLLGKGKLELVPARVDLQWILHCLVRLRASEPKFGTHLPPCGPLGHTLSLMD